MQRICAGSVSTHALREESDLPTQTCERADRLFQSTPSARRATCRFWIQPHPCTYFNPRPPRGGRRTPWSGTTSGSTFQSTPSARRATAKCGKSRLTRAYFNPRPPRGGRPFPVSTTTRSIIDFNPRPPRGGRHGKVGATTISSLFQSTPSARRATCVVDDWPSRGQISIHALREEGDSTLWRRLRTISNFNPRPPRGGRHHIFRHDVLTNYISIHALREEGDPQRQRRCVNKLYFNPRPPRGGRPRPIRRQTPPKKFQSTPSARRATACRQVVGCA